jgi:superfamily II DNA or RNA helicase
MAQEKQGAMGDELFGTPMDRTRPKAGGDLFIVDNSDREWKAQKYLSEWADVAHSLDIATGFFEIGALLSIDGQWQKLDKIRILMGDEVSRRTRRALLEGMKQALDDSVEREKEKNDFLTGAPAIIAALQSQQIEARVYTKAKFHAKAYITHAKAAVIGSSALVGSSNFTLPGLTTNVELNVQLRREVEALQEWYESHWKDAEDVSPEVLRVVQRHTAEYEPFDVYARALQQYFRGHELTVTEWERQRSRMFPQLDQYQKEGYQALVKIANTQGGAFLCDGVGLGKTFVGLMVIERLLRDRKKVALFVPKAARKPVWEFALDRRLPGLRGPIYSNLAIYNHTDLLRTTSDVQEGLKRIAEEADAVVIDEAHHFRNPGTKGIGQVVKPSRYRKMFELLEGKQVYLLTATPINNRLIDLQHMIELFSRRQPNYFSRAPLGIHSLPGHFRTMERQLDEIVLKDKQQDNEDAVTDDAEAKKVLLNDELFRTLVVQRSRAYVRASQKQFAGAPAIFTVREAPKVAKYSLEETYGPILEDIERDFYKAKPLFSLTAYYPLAYYIGDKAKIQDESGATSGELAGFKFQENRQKQLVRLIRIQFLKRFESSVRAFEGSCEALLIKLLAFVKKQSLTEPEKQRLERWENQHAALISRIHEHQRETSPEEDEDDDWSIIPDGMLDDIEELSRDEYDVAGILADTFLDLDEIARFLGKLQSFTSAQDDKLRTLLSLLENDQLLKHHKVLIFSEYMDTVRYVAAELRRAGIAGVDEVHSGKKRDRGEIIREFSPYYNGTTPAELTARKLKETRVLVSTDVLSEGLNLQDATLLINYDLHWNPVRLMQRIGRVDRRLDPSIEAKIVAEHPDRAAVRRTVHYWNFLPPGELDGLLGIYETLSRKTLKISKTFGIEGKKLLTPEDDFEALREFTHAYEGTPTQDEEMHLEYQRLLKEDPDLEERLDSLPRRVFSGKAHPDGSRAVFFCYSLPAQDVNAEPDPDNPAATWTEAAGRTGWYLYDFETGNISDDAASIFDLIRCSPDTPRQHIIAEAELTAAREKVEREIKNEYLKKVDAPVGVRAILKAWMELS